MAEFIKNIGIMDIDKNSMSSLALNTINVILFGSTFVFSTFVNNMDPVRSNEYPFYLIIYSYNLVFPCTLMGTIILAYYFKHPPLAKNVHREIIRYFGININS
jgi:hypothetical protein